MEKNKLLLIPLFIGILLIIYSWWLSYPLSDNSVNDLVFYHVSVIYWISLPILLTSMFMIAVTFKNVYLKWIMAVGIVITLYSLSYFYSMMPTIDSSYYRGLTEYFINTKNLTTLPTSMDPDHYFQWPFFFILAEIATSVSGLGLRNFEFLLYAVIGVLLSTTLFVYASKVFKNSGFLIAVAFFISLFLGFLNYQDAPFSLALALLFVMFMLESRQKSGSQIPIILVLFTSISLIHAFVPLYFILYALMRSILGKSKQYFNLFLLTLTIYLVTGITIAQFTFTENILKVITAPSDYSNIVTATLGHLTISVPIQAISQIFSRTITISIVTVCVIGSILMLIKRKMRDIDKAIFLSGAVFLIAGAVSYSLGSRAIAIAFIPISMGAVYLLESARGRKFRPYLISFFLILLSLFAFIPINNLIVTDFPIAFQTQESYTTANFMIEKYDWNTYSIILCHVNYGAYIYTQAKGNSLVRVDIDSNFNQSSNIENYDGIIYSVGMAKYLQTNNISVEETSQLIIHSFNIVYNSGLSYIAEKPG